WRATGAPSATRSDAEPSSRWQEPARGPAVERSAGCPGEVDEAAIDVGVDELYARPIADIEPLEAPHDFPLRRGPEDADPRALVRNPGHDPVEPFPHLGARGGP